MSSVAVVLTGTSVGGTCRSAWNGSAAAAAADPRFVALRVATAGSAHSIANEAMPRCITSRRVQRDSGGVTLTTDAPLPDLGRRAVARRIGRPQLIGVPAARERVVERPRPLLDLR